MPEAVDAVEDGLFGSEPEFKDAGFARSEASTVIRRIVGAT